MEMINFNRQTAKAITRYSSHEVVYQRIAAEIPDALIGIMTLDPGGLVGYHRALLDQLFLVVQGSGWVAGADRQRREITAGQAAFWREGEWHESGSEGGMIVVIIEGKSLPFIA